MCFVGALLDGRFLKKSYLEGLILLPFHRLLLFGWPPR